MQRLDLACDKISLDLKLHTVLFDAQFPKTMQTFEAVPNLW